MPSLGVGRPGSLSRLLSSKYGDSLAAGGRKQSRKISHVWRSILAGNQILQQGLEWWEVGDGTRIYFWLDKWLGTDRLADHVTSRRKGRLVVLRR